MKLLVIGNCQGRVLAHVMSTLWGVETLPTIVQFRTRPEDHEEQLDAMERADIILVQLTADDFVHEHLRSSVVAARYPDKTAIWPNLFYSGQQPFLRYLTHPEISRINGPLDVYHDLSILHEWRVARQATSKTDIDLDDLKSRISEASLRELERRESKCSAGVSDIIRDQNDVKRLFFTFNHPTTWLVTQLAKRLGSVLNLGKEIDTVIAKEFLSLITAPSELPPSETSREFWGKEFMLDDSGRISFGGRRRYTGNDLRACCAQLVS